jgi:hypothetical protein
VKAPNNGKRRRRNKEFCQHLIKNPAEIALFATVIKAQRRIIRLQPGSAVKITKKKLNFKRSTEIIVSEFRSEKRTNGISSTGPEKK